MTHTLKYPSCTKVTLVPTFKKIKDYTESELDQAIEAAVIACDNSPSPGFYEILKGIDAYFERRRRKEEISEAAWMEKVDKDFFGRQD